MMMHWRPALACASLVAMVAGAAAMPTSSNITEYTVQPKWSPSKPWHSPEVAPLNVSIPWLGQYNRLGGCRDCAVTRDNVIERAKRWVSEKVPYCQCAADCCGHCPYCSRGSPAYRCDCSGFVSWAWKLPGGLVTSTLPEVAHEIKKEDMKRGDVYLNDAVEGHVILFNGWANKEKTAFHAIQEAGCHAEGLPAHACSNIQTLPIWGEKGLFKPFRYHHITD